MNGAFKVNFTIRENYIRHITLGQTLDEVQICITERLHVQKVQLNKNFFLAIIQKITYHKVTLYY
jgi:hypothetical protein